MSYNNYINGSTSYIQDKYCLENSSSKYVNDTTAHYPGIEINSFDEDTENNSQSYASDSVFFSLIGIDLNIMNNSSKEWIDTIKLNLTAFDAIYSHTINVVETDANISSFNNLDGYRYYSQNYFGSLSRDMNYQTEIVYSVDISNQVKQRLNNDINGLVIELYPGISNRAWTKSFYSTRSSQTNKVPNIVITYDFDFYPLSGAWEYKDLYYTSMNCYGYALARNDWLTFNIDFPNYYVHSDENSPLIMWHELEHLSDAVILHAQNYLGKSVRRIADYNSPIGINEYRIGFRQGQFITIVKLQDQKYDIYYKYDFHFVVQNIEGSWSHKRGNAPTEFLCNQSTNPSDIFWGKITTNTHSEINNYLYQASDIMDTLLYYASLSTKEINYFLPSWSNRSDVYNSNTIFFAVTRNN